VRPPKTGLIELSRTYHAHGRCDAAIVIRGIRNLRPKMRPARTLVGGHSRRSASASRVVSSQTGLLGSRA
jgi:hypothetical protein